MVEVLSQVVGKLVFSKFKTFPPTRLLPGLTWVVQIVVDTCLVEHEKRLCWDCIMARETMLALALW